MAVLPRKRRTLVAVVTIFVIFSACVAFGRLSASTFDRQSIGISSKDEHQGKSSEKPKKVQLTKADKPMAYGYYDRPLFQDMTILGALPRQFVPTVDNKRRLVVVGDIHGMKDALDKLLEEVVFDASTDHLVAAGDMISKGPGSADVLSRLMALGASAVRGNHEDRVLLTRAELDSRNGASADISNADLENRRGQAKEMELARGLSQEHITWLQKLPVILTADPLPLIVVHAGLVPNVTLSRQDPWAVMNMRTLKFPKEELRYVDDAPAREKAKEAIKKAKKKAKQQGKGKMKSGQDGIEKGQQSSAAQSPVGATNTLILSQPGESDDQLQHQQDQEQDQHPFQDLLDSDHAVAVPISDRTGEPWYKHWNEAQRKLVNPTDRRTIAYGHDSKTGLIDDEYTIGLDSACVGGGKLSAVIFEAAEGSPGYKKRIVSVRCR